VIRLVLGSTATILTMTLGVTAAAVPTPTPAGERAAPTLTMAVPRSVFWEDRPIAFTGRFSRGTSGWFVSLWQLGPSGWVLRGATRTVAGGAYTIRHVPPAPGRPIFRTVVGGQPESTIAEASPLSVPIGDRRVTLSRPATAYAALTGVTLTGSVVPAESGRQVMLDYASGGRWRALRSASTDGAGRFRIRVPDDFPYRWVVRARTVERAAEYSGVQRFEVRAYLTPRLYAVDRDDVPSTYRSGCPVGPSALRRLVITYWGFDGRLHRGELILRDRAVRTMIGVWNAALLARFPVRRMQRVDVYGGNDIRSMAADNTSVFNCRTVVGNPYALSPHSYGYAIDINTVENPYQDMNGRWYPWNGLGYRDRSRVRPGMLFYGSTPTRALRARNYLWGAIWRHPDYQHFQPR
jgi:D-alanyl-D-alanine carboxypeptidase